MKDEETLLILVASKACAFKLKAETGDFVYCQHKLSQKCEGQMQWVCPSDCPRMKHHKDLLCDPKQCKSVKRWIREAKEELNKKS